MSTVTGTTIVPTWTLGWRLRRSLEAADVSVEEMARILQSSRSTLSRWLHDESVPKASYLVTWADTCGVNYYWLVGIEPPDGEESLSDRINRTVENQDDDTVNYIDLRTPTTAAA